MKLLICVTKGREYLYSSKNGLLLKEKPIAENFADYTLLNSKVVAECDYEVEEFEKVKGETIYALLRRSFFENDRLEIAHECNMTNEEIYNYMTDNGLHPNNNFGYAIRLSNTYMFTNPRSIHNYIKRVYLYKDSYGIYPLKTTPQNICRVYDKNDNKGFYMISVKPQVAYQILNGTKTMEIRKRIVMDMLNK